MKITAAKIAELGLDDRQKEVVRHVQVEGRIGNMEYQRLFSASKPTASRELEELRSMGVLTKVGTTGKGTHYVLAGKGLTKGSKGSSTSKGSQRAHGMPLPRKRKEQPK